MQLFVDEAGNLAMANYLFYCFVLALPTVRIYFYGWEIVRIMLQGPHWVSYPMLNRILPDAVWGAKVGLSRYIDLTEDGICLTKYCIAPIKFSIALACLLWLLHIYWFYRTIQLALRTLQNKGNVPGDPRYIETEADKKKK